MVKSNHDGDFDQRGRRKIFTFFDTNPGSIVEVAKINRGVGDGLVLLISINNRINSGADMIVK